MVPCRLCAFQHDGFCKLNPPVMVVNYSSPENQFTQKDQNTGYYFTTETRFPQVILSESYEMGGCFKGKLCGTYQREII